MRVVLDTNTVLSGLLWSGVPMRLLVLARIREISLFTSSILLDELSEVLSRDKFAAQLDSQNTTADSLMLGYGKLASLVTPKPIKRTVRDIDDDAVISTALAAQADIIVSGDNDLRVLHPYQGIQILKARAALQYVEARLKERSRWRWAVGRVKLALYRLRA